MKAQRSVNNRLWLMLLAGIGLFFGSQCRKAEPVQSGSAVAIREGEWQRLDDCHLIPHRHNDGDSFWVKSAAGEHEFRLYYVDAPESAAKTYRNGENNHRRLAQQAEAMGGLDQAQTVAIGREAKQWVAGWLSQGGFTVVTRWERVYGSERRYAFVRVVDGGRERDLHALLVSRGLARIHTKGAVLLDGTPVKIHKRQLRKLEQQAKRQKLGAWGLRP